MVKCGAFRNQGYEKYDDKLCDRKSSERCQRLVSQLDMSKLWSNGIKFSTTCF